MFPLKDFHLSSVFLGFMFESRNPCNHDYYKQILKYETQQVPYPSNLHPPLFPRPCSSPRSAPSVL